MLALVGVGLTSVLFAFAHNNNPDVGSLALETASKGITVNTVTPGYISTDMTAAVPGDVMDKLVARIPVGRLGEANEVARVVEFLADPESSYITGQVYPVNGGLYM